MAERTWLTIILCCVVWFAYLKWFAPPPPQPGAANAPTQAETKAPTPTPAPATAPAPAVPVAASGYFQPMPPQTDSITLDNGRLAVGLSDVGGKISHVSLTDYPESVTPKAPLIQLISPATTPYALSTLFSDPGLQKLGTGTYEHEQQGDVVRFHTADNGVKLSKEYRFTQNSYFVETKYQLTFPDDKRTDWGYLIVPVGDTGLNRDSSDPLHSWEVVSYQNESITRKAEEKLKDPETVLQGNTSWLAFGNRYFATAVINGPQQLNPDVVYAKTPQFLGGYLRYPLHLKAGEREVNLSMRYYIGPKSVNELSKVPGLRQLTNYGMFSIIAYPLLELLKFFYKLVHNYGVAIIILTLFVRLLFYPLSAKGARSMKQMQKLQPQIQMLKEKYKEDMQRFNQEQMALFKTHKVNPAGGCLPMLLQLPVFIALYAVLGYSIELFHAPFFLWIQDLSAKDPYYIFPVLMGVSMLLQQKLTTTAMMDPMQQKMMYFMPVIMTFFMAKLPSGLTLYIFLSTLLGIVQQLAINKEGAAAPELVPARSGGPK